jgi:hypothetical protein
MSGDKRDSYTPVAEQIPFDPDNCDVIDSENVQDAIDELCNEVITSASPGFTWGDSGNVTSNSWLLNDTVPSNKAGRLIYLTNPALETVFVTNQNINTFDLEVYEHDGTTFTLITTVSVVAARSGTFPVSSLALTSGKELAVKLVNGSGKNVVVGIQLSGTI